MRRFSHHVLPRKIFHCLGSIHQSEKASSLGLRYSPLGNTSATFISGKIHSRDLPKATGTTKRWSSLGRVGRAMGMVGISLPLIIFDNEIIAPGTASLALKITSAPHRPYNPGRDLLAGLRKLCPGGSAQEHTVPRRLCPGGLCPESTPFLGADRSWETLRARVL